jgi:hypothetical protein
MPTRRLPLTYTYMNTGTTVNVMSLIVLDPYPES